MIIGRVSRVDGTKVVGVFYEKLPPHIFDRHDIVPAPQINSFVKTNVGLDTIICQIVGEHEFEYDKADQIISEKREEFLVDLEVRGRMYKEKFLGGLRCLPIVGAKIETLTKTDYDSLFNVKGGIKIGRNLFDSSNQIYLDINKLMPSHIGIFGNTGSGKSNTLAKLLKEYMEIMPESCDNAKLIVFDLNNEYGGSAIVKNEQKQVYTLSTRKHGGNDKIPLNFSDLSVDNWGTLLKATQKTQMPVVRRAYKRWKDSDTDYVEQIKWILVNKRYQMFYALREYGGEFFDGLDELIFHKTQNAFYYYSGGDRTFIDGIDQCPEIKQKEKLTLLQRFLVGIIFEISRSSESGMNFEYIQPLIPRAKDIIKDLEKIFEDCSGSSILNIFANKPLTVIQLGDVNSGTRELVPALISELLFQNAVSNKKDKTESILSIVVDEAHNLLAYDDEKSDIVHNNTLRVFEKIIKEGRKFGVFLYLASQRPSDISSTITSQIHNYFIHKLVNPNDIDKIRKTVAFMGDASLSMLSSLGQGECIVSGPSLYMPQYVYVDELESVHKPCSNDLILFGENGILRDK